MSALYLYTSHCHDALKQAAVFPFQMELKLDPPNQKYTEVDDDEEQESLVCIAVHSV